MKNDTPDKRIIEITPDYLGEAVEVLAGAFEDDPIIRYFLAGHRDDYLKMVRELFRYQCLMYIELKLPIFGTLLDSHITGVACLSLPGKKDRPDSLLDADKDFELSMGPDSFGRIKRYMELNKKHTPEGPHHYLAALGVRPDRRGQGFARLLMDLVSEISESNTVSTGVYLETAKAKNVEMYEYFGYKQIAAEKLDGIVDLWYMFRPKKKND